MIILGLNGYAGADHDPAAALVIDDTLVAAVEEERITRVRHAPGRQPLRAAAEVLAVAGVTASEIDVVAHGWRPDVLGLATGQQQETQRIRSEFERAGLALRRKTRVEFVEHHVAHFWSALPFIPDGVNRAAVDGLVIDGAGESTSGALFQLRDGQLDRSWHLTHGSSLGLAYEAVTRLLGFGRGEEGKTMGLAAYGRIGLCPLPPPPDERFHGALPALKQRGDLDAHARAEFLRYRPSLPAGASFNERADFALGAQQMLELRVLEYLEELADLAPVVVLSGGVALNCTMNGRVARWCQERGSTLVIPPSANDSGVAVGAAVAASEEPSRCRSPVGALLGPERRVGTTVDELRGAGATVEVGTTVAVAELLAGGAVVGWLAGRAEFGPRALGARCLLASPDSTAIRDLVNVKKGRESWRPLAPSVLDVSWADCFSGTPSPYMLVVSDVRLQRRRQLAGVTHADNSTRPQFVPSDGSPYAGLLAAVGESAGGVAALTCTSFNVGGQPIVHTSEHALEAARQMGLAALAGDGWIIRLNGSGR